MNTSTQGIDPSEVARGRRTLLGLAALFFVPLAIAFYLYYAGGWRPAGSTNHGELIVPVRPLEDAAFTLPDGTTSARVGLLREKWSLVYVGPGSCDAACQRALWVMRQTRLLLAEDMSRVQRVFLSTRACCNEEFLKREHAGLETVQAVDPAAIELLTQFPQDDQANMIFIVDPLGNLMMRFDARQEPKGLLSDLQKLLKLSHIG